MSKEKKHEPAQPEKKAGAQPVTDVPEVEGAKTPIPEKPEPAAEEAVRAPEAPDPRDQEIEALEAQAAATAEQIETMTSQLADANDKFLRLFAEFDNYRKRTQREKDGAYAEGSAAAVKAMLPVLDNFERAAAQPCADEAFGKGVGMILQTFTETLASLGVEPIGEEGEPFDPAVHNAVMHVEDDKLGKNVVAKVLQKGYRMGDRVLRCAMVQQAN